jgi:hypothetical protein
MHAAAEWASLTGSLKYIYNGEQPGVWTYSPELGSPPRAVAERLVAVLANYTGGVNRCWFGVSDIWNSPLHDNINEAPKFGTDFRQFFLLKGPLRSALSSPHAKQWDDRLPGLWWPDDRSWFVGSDVDLLSTYVGGCDACIGSLVEVPLLEVSRGLGRSSSHPVQRHDQSAAAGRRLIAPGFSSDRRAVRPPGAVRASDGRSLAGGGDGDLSPSRA